MGADGIGILRKSHIAVFGIGGVGSFTAEALARAGVGELTLIDNDIVCASNINRQLIALSSTLGRAKVDVMKERILDINPDATVHARRLFFGPETAAEVDFSSFNYVTDAVDTVSAKISIILRAKEADLPVISCMGAGNKLNPTAFQVADIKNTSVCPLAKVMRRELKKRGVSNVKVVFSKENPVLCKEELLESEKRVPGSVSFVPSVAGLILAGEAIRDILENS